MSQLIQVVSSVSRRLPAVMFGRPAPIVPAPSPSMGDLVGAARRGDLASRRSFLAAAVALGLGEREAERELLPRIALPGRDFLNLWHEPQFRWMYHLLPYAMVGAAAAFGGLSLGPIKR